MAVPLLTKKIVKKRVKRFIRPQSDRKICVKVCENRLAFKNGRDFHCMYFLSANYVLSNDLVCLENCWIGLRGMFELLSKIFMYV